MEQLSFLEENKEERLEREVERLKDQCEKVRKGQYAKIAALNKICNELHARMEIYDAFLCKRQPIEPWSIK